MNRYNGILWLVPILLAGCTGTRPSSPGVRQARLAPCPKSPNCVSTQSADERHRIDPLRYTTTISEAKERLLGSVRSMPRTTIVTLEEDYIRAEFKSRIFGFVDDVEFWFEDGQKVIHFRSASRVGYSDLGANRKRMEKIRERFQSKE